MDNKYISLEEEAEDQTEVKTEHEEASELEYEFESEELYVPTEEGQEIEAIEEDSALFEIVVDEDIKESKKDLEMGKYSRKSTAGDFIILELDGNQKAYRCDICMKTFKDKSKLKTHREIHTDERNVICPVSCRDQYWPINLQQY